MTTQRLTTSPTDVATATQLLNQGELVAFPTETVYGLGANLWQPKAVRGIFTTKGRPTDNPLIAHIGRLELLDKIVAELLPTATRLITAFWPGPLTLVLPAHPNLIGHPALAGHHTVAVRMPNHPIAQHLCNEFPVVAPSANKSGLPSPTTADHVLADLDGLISALIDDGPTQIGIESTVVDVTTSPATLLRPGDISLQQLQKLMNFSIINLQSSTVNRSPGMKYRHYAPHTKVVQVLPGEAWQQFDQPNVMILSNLDTKPKSANHQPLTTASLFAHFRQADQEQKSVIVVVWDETTYRHAGLRNRVEKAVAG